MNSHSITLDSNNIVRFSKLWISSQAATHFMFAESV